MLEHDVWSSFPGGSVPCDLHGCKIGANYQSRVFYCAAAIRKNRNTGVLDLCSIYSASDRFVRLDWRCKMRRKAFELRGISLTDKRCSSLYHLFDQYFVTWISQKLTSSNLLSGNFLISLHKFQDNSKKIAYVTSSLFRTSRFMTELIKVVRDRLKFTLKIMRCFNQNFITIVITEILLCDSRQI